MKEIEVKARVRDRAALMRTLAQKGVELSEPVHQEDTIYVLGAELDKFSAGTVYVRIRQQGGTAIFNLKRSLSNELDSLEHKVIVSDAATLATMLALIGFRPTAQVVKRRQKARYGDYELCLDEVERLGTFIELEQLAPDGADSATAQTELLTVLMDLGLDPADRVLNGYDTLIEQLNQTTQPASSQ